MMSDSIACESFSDSSTGFTFSHDGQQREFQNDDILGLRICAERQVQNGECVLAKSLHFRIGPDQWAAVDVDLVDGQSDSLHALETRVLDSLVRRSWETLQRGGDVRGDGWTLNLLEFALDDGTRCSLQQISKATWDTDQLCIWHEDESAAPFVRLPHSGENVIVLHRLLTELVQFVEPETPEVAVLGMGQRMSVFYTDHRHRLPARPAALVVLVMLAALLSVTSLYTTGICILFVLLIALTSAPVLRGYRETLSHFELGLIWSCGGQERVLLVEQIKSLQVDWRRRDVATLDSPAIWLRATSVNPEDQPIDMAITDPTETAQQSIQQHEDAIRALQRHVSANIAERLSKRIAEHGVADLGDGLRIGQHVIEVDPTGSGDPDVRSVKRINRSEIADVSLSERELLLRNAGGNILLRRPASHENIYAAYLILALDATLTTRQTV